MKYYLLNILDRVKIYSLKLDEEAILYDKSWVIFNDTEDKEVFIFRPDNELLISYNGIVSKGEWEILSTNHILIDMVDKSYMFNISFVSNELLALNLDGNNEFLIMIEESIKNRTMIKTLSQIEHYLDNKYKLEKVNLPNVNKQTKSTIKHTQISTNQKINLDEKNTLYADLKFLGIMYLIIFAIIIAIISILYIV